jgi:type VI protein secretion system component Hcp
MPIYMEYEGIPGSVKMPGCINWILLESCQLGPNRPGPGVTGQGAKPDATTPNVSEIVVTKVHDASSHALFRESLQGKGRKVTIVFAEANGSVRMKIVLENVLISNYTAYENRYAPNKPLESMTLNFSAIKFTVASEGQARIDNVQGGYDLGYKKGQ